MIGDVLIYVGEGYGVLDFSVMGDDSLLRFYFWEG
jgi:hypothetical protein